MSENKKVVTGTIDGNEAAAYVMYRVNEVCCIYPITPSSNMAELADEWAAKGIKNIWGNVPLVAEMQSEGGAAGAVHGSLQAGALTTTFTASQGLLLKIPNMYKIAGELTSTVFNISARTLATHALSIFGDHSDIMSARQTGFAFLGANSVQEVMDIALISQASTLEARVPFLHWFDGFRTSHEVSKIEILSDEVIREMINDDLVNAHRERSLSPDKPVIRGTAQNPDVYFQNREAANKYYEACPDIIQKQMDKFAKLTGRQYNLFQYEGDPNAEHIIVIMGSGCEIVADTVEHFNAKGEKFGLLKVRVYRPFDVKRFMESLPATVKTITVLDRTKESGAIGDPLYIDVLAGLHEGLGKYGTLKSMPTILGGRYGLSSKEFTPPMAKAIYENAKSATPKNHFVVGIEDDVTNSSLPYNAEISTEHKEAIRAMFYGLGSDGTVGANKNSIKIIGDSTDFYAQGYFVYDSKKAGGITVSHLRFGPKPIRSPYTITHANFVACHQTVFLEKYDLVGSLVENGIFLTNSPVSKDEVWNTISKSQQQLIIDKKIKLYTIDAQKVAEESGMGRRINTIMQVCFFAISGVLPKDEAIEAIKKSIIKSYSRKGDEVVQQNLQAVDNTLENLFEVNYPNQVTSTFDLIAPVTNNAPKFVKEVLGEIIANRGDKLPVSAFPADGTFPTATSQYEKRSIALEIPVWEPESCLQCLKCNIICPHASIRGKVYDAELLKDAPATFKSVDAKDKEFAGKKFTIQIAPEDCTGCGVCVEACPGKNKKVAGKKVINLEHQAPLRHQEAENWTFFNEKLPVPDRTLLKTTQIRQQQYMQPLFEFSGACAGCGETPYIKLVSQLYGDRAVVANATGCSSIYGGNLPTTPWSKNQNGRGPAWANSLFEDNAEFGFGMRLAVDKQAEIAKALLPKFAAELGDTLVDALLNAKQDTEVEIAEQRKRVEIVREKLTKINNQDAKNLMQVLDYLVKKSVWIIGGDGWAYDIGYGGLDHVIASNKNVNILVVDTEVYSNTGGQNSKSTPLSAVAKFAAGGKMVKKKDLGLIAMSYGYVYVASIALGAKDDHALKVMLEAEAYDGPSLIICYAHCIAHGIDMSHPLAHQKAAVDTGQWLLYRYNPALIKAGQNPLILDSKEPKLPVIEYLRTENRFMQLEKQNPEMAKVLFAEQQKIVDERYKYYKYLADRP